MRRVGNLNRQENKGLADLGFFDVASLSRSKLGSGMIGMKLA